MDLGENDKFGLGENGEDHMNYNPSSTSTDWQISMAAVCQGNQMGFSQCPSVSMVDSFNPTLWDHRSNSQGYAGANASGNNTPIVKPVPGPLRVDIAWNPLDPMSKGGGMFSEPGNGILPGMSQFPTDSAFIERAARFSCFGGGSFTGMTGPFESANHYSNQMRAMVVAGAQPQRNEPRTREDSRDLPDMCVGGGQRFNDRSSMDSQRDNGNSHGIGDRMEFSGSGQEETTPSTKGLPANKRKRNTQEMETDHDQAREEPDGSVEAAKEKDEGGQKDEQNTLNIGISKHDGKQVKDGADPPKEDYIHVRARRGQATNSHSLAERVRREKISERMKFLQDLVPGCSKVTGKAVMLDEIINYVQSLQRQVEFLSMKLATVNPHLDFNIEGLLPKDMIQSRPGSASTIAFSPELAHPFLQQTSQGLVQSGIPSIEFHPRVFRRVINAQLTAISPYKEAKQQMPNPWDDELHNVLSQMGFESNLPHDIHESNDKSHDCFPDMKP